MVTELLEVGRENAKSIDELTEILNVTPRRLHRMIREERRSGCVILSTKDAACGYWLWGGDLEELARYYKMQRSAAIDALETLKPVRRLLKGGGVDVK